MLARRSCLLLGMILLLGQLTACNYKSYFQKSTNDYASRSANDPKMMHVRSYGSHTANPKQHDNRYFEYSSALSNKVASLPGINTALVFITDKNAYVGIMTDWSATGTEARGGPRSHEQDNSGTTEGVYNVSTGSSKWDNRQVATPYNSYFTHKDYGSLSSELRQVIGDTIRKEVPRVQEVHISANREFVNQSLEFAKASWLKKPLAPLTKDFNTLVKYTFNNGNQVPVPLYVKQKPSQ
ncbi:YhcN/YlaJ family sporulation lipoprotein [Cohnella mopanensis]|uniref:YhcN/YlaJ family sporulation lipoprotein n=1 Tax=Cohnella mopanensis TaxID=2911966 RepID=UPI001EF88F3E|nr:YhcN/YlaJ family sporulation lipoprotein [Cohnella mopanensis]